MKLVIIIVAAVLILGGGGGAGWWFLLREPPSEEALAEAAAAEEDSKKKDISKQATFDLDPFVLPILREGQVTEHLTLMLRLEFHEPQTRPYFKGFKAELRDEFLSELHGLFAFRHVQQAGEGLPVVRQRLVVAGDRVFGAGMVKAVLVQGASRRVPDEG